MKEQEQIHKLVKLRNKTTFILIANFIIGSLLTVLLVNKCIECGYDFKGKACFLGLILNISSAILVIVKHVEKCTLITNGDEDSNNNS